MLRMYKLKTLNTFVIYFHFLFSKEKYCHGWIYRAAITFFNSNGRDGLLFVFCLLLFCHVLLVAVLYLFQKPAINNSLTSKGC